MTGASRCSAAEVRRRTEAVQEQPRAVHQGICCLSFRLYYLSDIDTSSSLENLSVVLFIRLCFY